MSALLVGLLSFQGVIALRDRLVGIFKPGLFTWVSVLTNASVKCAWIDYQKTVVFLLGHAVPCMGGLHCHSEVHALSDFWGIR